MADPEQVLNVDQDAIAVTGRQEGCGSAFYQGRVSGNTLDCLVAVIAALIVGLKVIAHHIGDISVASE